MPSLSDRVRVCAMGGAMALCALAARPACAQQTIINVPSVDQTKDDHVFYLHESQVRDWDGAEFWQTTNFFTYGVTDRVEAAATFYNIGSPEAPNRAVGLGWKTAQPVLRGPLPELELTLGAGQQYIAPLSNLRVDGTRRDKRFGVWNYGQAAFRLPVLGTRIMAGVSSGPTALFGQRTTHMIASYEQPLTKVGQAIGGPAGRVLEKVTLLGEWWSGRHELADFVPGFNWHPGKMVVVVGYKLSNKRGSRTDGLILEVGRTF